MGFRKIVISSLALVLSSGPVSAQNLKDVARHAVKTNPEALSAKAARLASWEQVGQARGGYFPRLDLTVGRGRESSKNDSVEAAGRSYRTLTRRENTLTLSQLLYDGGNVWNRVKSRRYDFESADFAWVQARQTVSLSTVQAYLDVLRSRRLLDLAEQNVRDHQDTVRKVKARKASGAGNRVDIDLAMSRLALSKSTRDRLKGLVRESNARYYAVTDLWPSELVMPNAPYSKLPKTLNEALKTAYQYSPVLQASRASLKAAGARVGEARANFIPTFSLELKASDNNNLDGVSGPNNDRQAMVVMTYNLFNGGTDKNFLDEAHANRVRSLEDYNLAARQVKEDVTVARSNLLEAKQRYEKLKRYAHSSAQVVKGYEKQFKLGQRQLFNVLDAKNEMFNARSAETNALFEMMLNAYAEMATEGTLLCELGLNKVRNGKKHR